VVEQHDVADARDAHLADAAVFVDQESLRAEALRGLDRQHAEQAALMFVQRRFRHLSDPKQAGAIWAVGFFLVTIV
jgi:hypothetical protein